MRKKKRSDESGFNVWRSYSDMMAGVLLLFVLIMCVTLFQAQKSYNESIKERDDKIALQEQYTAEILSQQTELDEKNSQLSSQDEQLDKQKKLLAELAAQLKEQQATLDKQQTDLDEKTSLLATQQKKIDNIIGVKADVIEALQKEFSKNNVSVDIDSQTGALTLNASVLFDYDQSELTDSGKESWRKSCRSTVRFCFRTNIRNIWQRSLLMDIRIQMEIIPIIWSFPRNVPWLWPSI